MNIGHYALVVGIGRYPGHSDLAAPVNDAHAFRAWLLDHEGGGLPEGNVRLVTTPDDLAPAVSSRDATPVKEQIDNALLELEEQVTAAVEGDPSRWSVSRLYLYVAGHGIMPDRSDTTALLMANSDQRRGIWHNIDIGLYLSWYARSAPYSEIVAFADCCRSWRGSAEGMPPPFTRVGRPREIVRQMACYASAPDQVAYEETDALIPLRQRHGYFTKALLAALREAPADEVLGGITSVTIGPYLKTSVRAATEGRRTTQTVQVITDSASPILLASNRTDPLLHRVKLRFPPGYRGKVDLVQNEGSAQTWDVTCDRATPLRLAAGLYSVFESGTYKGTPFRDDGKFAVLGQAAQGDDGIVIQL
ncbi:caspase family protein [Amycolatopsis japonica]|uniref:caspase family protein n=1 Tax=Amycolatopsis japonica TaxID=208439 RepID=UPI0034019391